MADETRLEVDDINPNIVWEVWPDGYRERHYGRKGSGRGRWKPRWWWQGSTGRMELSESPSWVSKEDGWKLRRLGGVAAMTRNFLKRMF